MSYKAGVGMLQDHWPWAVGILGLLVVYVLLRKASVSYSRRISRELEKYVTPPQPPPPQPPPNPPVDSSVLAEHRQRIWQNIRDHPLPPNLQIDVLVNLLAEAQVHSRFSNLYYLIYRSQHLFLKGLCSQNGTTPRATAEEFLKKMAEQNDALKTVHFNDWIGFLVAQGVVSPGVSTFDITPIGRDFVVWVIRQGLPDKLHE